MRKDRFDLVKKAITSRPDAYKNPQRVGNKPDNYIKLLLKLWFIITFLITLLILPLS